jgi:hypothetical protein
MRRYVPNARRTLNGVAVVFPSSVTSIVNVSVRFGTGSPGSKGGRGNRQVPMSDARR